MMETTMNSSFTIAGALLIGSSAIAQQSGHDMGGMAGMPMASMQQPAAAGSPLQQGGEAAFAAIAEVTRALEADPNTDWSKVNIAALRAHLVDMDNVTVRANVATSNVPGGARFDITSADPRVRESIDRMVRLHASMANQEGPFRLATAALPDGTALTAIGPSASDQAKIRGLGFFGLMTEGVHHQLHHMMLARGEDMHH
jgi:hypothetical protein